MGDPRPRDSVILVSGATGTDKTLVATEFMAGGAARGERGLLFAFEESRQQLCRNATSWGMDFERIEGEGNLRVLCAYSETDSLEDHLIRMKQAIESFEPHRVAVDSLSALERVSTDKGFRELVIGLSSFIKHQEIAGLLTATTPSLLGASVTEAQFSTITDAIVLLRYVEMPGEMRRGLTVLEMRGPRHDRDIREYSIDEVGMHIGRPFRNVSGILGGRLRHLGGEETGAMRGLLPE
jgi:circadian clock protein KaiC